MNARKKVLFQQTYAATGCLSAAARAAEISVTEGRKVRGEAPPTAEHSLRAAVTALESEAVRRALEGVAVPVFHQGKECGNTVKHSDTLLMFLLKTLSPARYGAESTTSSRTSKQGRPVLLEIDLSAAENGGAEEGSVEGGNVEDMSAEGVENGFGGESVPSQ